MSDLVNRTDLLMTALYCGGIYAAWRITIAVFYPLVIRIVWQYFGSYIIQYHPNWAQNKDRSRPSYLAFHYDDPYVFSHGFFSISFADLTNGIRDGFLLGVFFALLPDFVGPTVLGVLLVLVLSIDLWKVFKVKNDLRTDRIMYAIYNLLLYSGAIIAIYLSIANS